ncbi:Fe-Mn family superoxide dismutase [Anaerospora hongkongensis]|uniref:superoxide dismutase n=1 Tax=Anaerospora hongkongensis TaxID=244830 RepID=A0A4R1PVN2_9FIRM|nr:Fe-Mn family superoxide dismutase [Anaerospora hongkongensis]TCL35431.1 Fe-Mn family superoxide dismutase [Anaerospora hongkongensis]
MVYKVKDYSHLLGMEGFSNRLLKNHFTLYEGYVKNTNLLLSTLEDLIAEGKGSTPEYAELKRRLGWEYDGMRLHEYYFANLGGNGEVDDECHLVERIEANFGSLALWQADFIATGMMRGVGWAVLYRDNATGRLINFWINEHDTGHPSGGSALLVMDVWEHAYMLDYGLNRHDYIDAFFRNLDWNIVDQRLRR